MSVEMKDSGINWIGEIPKHWEVKRFKNFIELINTPSCSLNKIGLENIEGETGHFIPSESKFEGNGIQFLVNNIVYGKLRPYLQKVWLATFDGNAVGDFFVFKTQNNSIPKYVKWLMLSDGFTKMVDSSTYGAKMPRVASDFILNLPFYLPSVEEQSRIANFLDKKCAEIDELIALQEQMIVQLTTYKQAVITETVTKGLDPNVKMKDSGVEWIGEIPEHWDITKLKNLLTLKTGTTPKAYEDKSDYDKLINWYTPSDILENGNIILSSERNIAKRVLDEENISLYPSGSLMFVGIGALAGKVGYALEAGYSNQQITALIPKKCNSKYYYYYLIADKKRIRDNAFFTTLPIINNGYLGQVIVLSPSIEEQQSIAQYLDQKCKEIDELISIKKEKIEHLKAYKKSVIYEYVTGKKSVES